MLTIVSGIPDLHGLQLLLSIGTPPGGKGRVKLDEVENGLICLDRAQSSQDPDLNTLTGHSFCRRWRQLGIKTHVKTGSNIIIDQIPSLFGWWATP